MNLHVVETFRSRCWDREWWTTLQALKGPTSNTAAGHVTMTSTAQKAGAEYGDIGWTARMNGHNTSLMLIIFA
jgi:hypothetical protein